MYVISSNKNRSEVNRRIVKDVLIYIIVMLFLAFINYMLSPGYWWVVWPAAGWGLGLAIGIVNKLFDKTNN